MILVTVGTQLPFDRLVKAMDKIAPSLGGEKIICQTLRGKYKPINLECKDYIVKSEYEMLFKEARIIVSHAGIGSILNAIKYDKNIIIMPRLASLKEHRNDHQLHTADALRNYENIYVADDECQLSTLLLNSDFSKTSIRHIIKPASSLSESIKSFLLDNI